MTLPGIILLMILIFAGLVVLHGVAAAIVIFALIKKGYINID